jgi:hypothetical protein
MATLTAEAVRNARMHFYFPYLCDHGHRQNGAPYGKCQSCDSPNVWPIQTISPWSLAPIPPLHQRHGKCASSAGKTEELPQVGKRPAGPLAIDGHVLN